MSPSPPSSPPFPRATRQGQLTLKDVDVEIAPGVKYTAWGFEGGAPGRRSMSERASGPG